MQGVSPDAHLRAAFCRAASPFGYAVRLRVPTGHAASVAGIACIALALIGSGVSHPRLNPAADEALDCILPFA